MDNQESFLYNTNVSILVLLLFLGMLIIMKVGSFVGHRLRKKDDEGNDSVNTTVMAAVLGLFAFLLGFTFSMSGNRFESRRINNITEANAIGTAISRADLYPAAERDSLRRDFKEYTMARIQYFQIGNDLPAVQKADRYAQDIGSRLWNRASTDAIRATSVFPSNLMIPALNEMLDSANANNYGEKFRVPDPIVILLFALSLVCAFFVGYYTLKRDWFNRMMTVGFCLLSSIVIYTTLDLDRSRTGLIKHHVSLEALSDLMKQFDHP